MVKDAMESIYMKDLYRAWKRGYSMALFPGLHTQLLSLAVWKAGERPGRIYHMMCCGWRHVQSAHFWVCSLPFTLLSLNSVHSFCSVCLVSPITTGSIVA